LGTHLLTKDFNSPIYTISFRTGNPKLNTCQTNLLRIKTSQFLGVKIFLNVLNEFQHQQQQQQQQMCQNFWQCAKFMAMDSHPLAENYVRNVDKTK